MGLRACGPQTLSSDRERIGVATAAGDEAAARQEQPRMGRREWLLLLLLSLLWGGSFLFAKVAVMEWPPIAVVLARTSLAALLLAAATWLSGISLAAGLPLWRAFFVMGLLNNLIPFGLIFWGQTQIGAGLAAILNATTPVFGVLVAHVFGRNERATPAKLAGVAAGLAGVAILIGPEALAGLGLQLWPELACLGAALSYGFSSLYGRRFSGLPPLVTATGQLSATSLMALPLLLLLAPPWTLPVPSTGALAAMLALATVSTAVAYVIFFEIMRKAGGGNAILVTFLVPVSAVLLGILVLGEALAPRHLAGLLVILLGLALIDGRLLAKAAGPR